MDRRKAIGFIGAILSVPFIPLGMKSSKDEEQIINSTQSGTWKNDFIDQINMNDAYLNRWEYVNEKHRRRIIQYGQKRMEKTL